MAVTPDEMRAMAERLDKQADAMVEAGYKGWPNCNRSASEMLRSIAEEREAPPSPTRLPDCFSISGKVKDGEHKGETVWLYWSPEGGGWWQWSSAKGCAYRFSSKDDQRFKDAWPCAKGETWLGHTVGPWYYMPDIETIECVPSSSQETKGAE